MKATGIVRRIDDLGRIVIPKEIRKTHGIKEGDPMEIFTDGRDSIVLKKYQPDTWTSDELHDALVRVCNETCREPVDYLNDVRKEAKS
jgi:transcriptional pleiotropic regulator of transition state genes